MSITIPVAPKCRFCDQPMRRTTPDQIARGVLYECPSGRHEALAVDPSDIPEQWRKDYERTRT